MIPDKHRVMIVDDDADMRSLIAMSLSESYEVFEASNGLDAMLKLTKYQPDLAIIDIMMPLMDGNELIRKIRSSPGNEQIPILALSALNQKDDIKQGYEAGADLYLTKPFNPERLMRNVKLSLESRPVRHKDLSIEEVEERDRRFQEQMKRALEKKKYEEQQARESREAERHSEPRQPEEQRLWRETPAPRRKRTPPPEPVVHGSSEEGHARVVPASRLPRIEGITAPRTTPAEPVRRPPAATPPPEDFDPDPFGGEREGVVHRHGDELPPHMTIPAEAGGPKVRPATGEIVPRVMLVDDDEEFLLVMRAVLEEEFEIVLAHDGFDAINKIPEMEPDIFVVDAMMPRMSGYQFVDTIKGSIDTYFKPIIFASAKGNARDIKLAQQKGAAKYLVKPFSPEDLRTAIREVTKDPNFRPAIKTKSIQEILIEEGRRRAAHMSYEHRKKMWESFGTIQSFLKDLKSEGGEEKEKK